MVSLLSLIGLAVIAVPEQKLKRIILSIVALATGALFADALLELLPESYKHSGPASGLLVLAGMAVFFVLERFLSWKHEHTVGAKHYKSFGYMNLAADSIHNFADGLIIGVSYLASVEIGISTTLAVVFHEIPHEMGNFFVLLYAGFSKTRALLFNLLTAITAIAGTVLALIIGSKLESFSNAILPIAAGGFIYIAGTDLLPELSHDTTPAASLRQLVAMAAGVAIIWLLRSSG